MGGHRDVINQKTPRRAHIEGRRSTPGAREDQPKLTVQKISFDQH